MNLVPNKLRSADFSLGLSTCSLEYKLVALFHPSSLSLFCCTLCQVPPLTGTRCALRTPSVPCVVAMTLAFLPACAANDGLMITFVCRLCRRMLLILLLRLPLSMETTGGEYSGGEDKCSVILSSGGSTAAAFLAAGSGISEFRRGSGISDVLREAWLIGCG